MNDISNLSVQVEFTTDKNTKINGLSNINESLSCHYLIYKMTNLINGKYYIGQHQTENPLDDYIGSGFYLNRAESAYGLSSFVKTILFDFDNFNLMNNKEKELVQLSNCFPYDQMSYNLKEGGSNGSLSKESIEKCRQTKNLHKDEICNNIKAARKKYFENENNYHSHLKQMKDSGLFDQRAEKNGMYGEFLSSHMSIEKYKIWHERVTQSNRKKAKDPAWHKKMSEVTSGKNNGMYGVSLHDKLSPEEIEQWKHNISLSQKGKPGNDSWKNLTLEQRKERIDRFSKSIKGKNKGRKPLIDTKTGKKVFVKGKEYDECIANGYVPYSNKGKKLMFRPGQDRVSMTVDREEVNTFLEKGYVIGNIGQILLNRKDGNKDPYTILMISTEKKVVRVRNGSIQKCLSSGYVKLSDYYPEIVSNTAKR